MEQKKRKEKKLSNKKNDELVKSKSKSEILFFSPSSFGLPFT
jgi:hypothetical protein